MRPLSPKNSRIAASQEGINRINWFLVCCYNFRKFWLVEVKNGHGFLGHGSLKSAVSPE